MIVIANNCSVLVLKDQNLVLISQAKKFTEDHAIGRQCIVSIGLEI